MLLGLDVGGTHTDVVLVDRSGVVAAAKTPTIHENLIESVRTAIQKLAGEVDAKGIERINLSTTLSTNAIVEDKTEKVGVLVSSGPGIDPERYRIGDHYYAISGSLDHRGEEILELDQKQLDAAIRKSRKAGIRVYAAVTKFSTRNPDQENMIRTEIGDAAEFVTVGHRLSGRLNFPRRIVTAYYNSAVWRIYRDFADAVERNIEGFGIKAPVNILKADGGTMPLSASRELPVETILSGPAASVMGIVALCRIDQDSIILDIGGTTTDIAVFASGAPLIEPDGIALDSRLTLVRSLKTRSIGIGGDSFLKVQNGEVLAGPERRGPAMAEGGASPTLIDAFNSLGMDTFGNVNASRAGIEELSSRHGMKAGELAARAVDYAVKKIVDEVRAFIDEINEKPVYTIHEFLEGRRIRPSRIYLMGGPARAFEEHLARSFNIHSVTPKNYAVANAIGAALARPTMYIELLADTERGRMLIPDIGVARDISHAYTLEEAQNDARRHLSEHLKNISAGEGGPVEIVEAASFSMVRGYESTGKNIRVKCQIKPGVIEDYAEAVRS